MQAGHSGITSDLLDWGALATAQDYWQVQYSSIIPGMIVKSNARACDSRVYIHTYTRNACYTSCVGFLNLGVVGVGGGGGGVGVEVEGYARFAHA